LTTKPFSSLFAVTSANQKAVKIRAATAEFSYRLFALPGLVEVSI